MPDNDKPKTKAPIVSKYASAEKYNGDPTKAGYKKQETIGDKTYFDKEANKAVSGGAAGPEWRNSIIKQLQSGVSTDELVAKGHISPSAVNEFKQYYKPVYTEPIAPITNTATATTQPYAGTRNSMTLLPKNSANQSWDTYSVPDLNGQVNQSKQVSVYNGKILDNNKLLQTGDPSQSLTNEDFVDTRNSNVRSDAQGSTNLPTMINGVPVTSQGTTQILKPKGDKSSTVGSDTNGGFKKGGLIGKIKGYDNGGIVDPEDPNFVAPEETDTPIQTPSKFNKYIKNPNNQQGISNGIGGLSQLSQVGGLAIDATNNSGMNGKVNVDKSTLSGGLKGLGKGAALGASIGSVIGPEGTLIGAGIGAVGGGIAGLISGHHKAEGLNQDIQNQLDANALAKKKANADGIFQSNLSRQLAQRQAGYADGGIIKGSGTGTSDSIKAKIKPDSFVVPAKNAKAAEVIRKVILPPTSKKKAELNQTNGESVKVSNGEHLFTPEEKNKIISAGIDINTLAPDADNTQNYGGGGPIPGVSDKLNASKGKTKAVPTYYSKKVANKIIADNLASKDINGLPVNSSNPEVNIGDLTPSDNIGYNNTPKKSGLRSKIDLSKLSGLGDAAEGLVPALQAGYGLQQLRKTGARPVGQIDQDYLNSINKARQNVDLANANAQYGFTPEEQALINNKNNELTNEARFDARNLSGGSAGGAYNLERGAINDSFGRGLQAAVQNKNLMLQKQNTAMDRQGYLDSLIAGKQQMSRQLFEDKLNAFNTNQQAGASLVGAGISNLIGLKRYQDEIAATKNTQNIRNSAYNSIGQ